MELREINHCGAVVVFHHFDRVNYGSGGAQGAQGEVEVKGWQNK